MALTNFAALDDHQKMVWSRDVWHQAREKMFTSRFVGTGQNSMIQRITELTKSERGTMAVYTMVPDLEEDGITSDNTLEGNEAALKAVQGTVQIDQLRNAVRNSGRLTDQKTVVNFREQAKDQLSYWLADRADQLSFLTLAGLAYNKRNNAMADADRGGNLNSLAFAADVSGPSSERHITLKANGVIADGDGSASLTSADTIGYDHIVQMQALAKTRYVRGIRGNGGSEIYHLFLHPMALAKLKLDPDFKENARHAGSRGSDNTLWKGGESYIVDGLHIHEFRHVPTTLGGATKWNSVDASRALLCGSQALAMVDLDAGYWDEDQFDYSNQYGIAYGKMFGLAKPKMLYAKGAASNDTVKQDVGVIAVDMAI